MKRYRFIQCLVLLFAVLCLSSLPSHGGMVSGKGRHPRAPRHLEQRLNSGSTDPINVIVQIDRDSYRPDQTPEDLPELKGSRKLRRVGGHAKRLTPREIRRLLESPRVRYITEDVPIRPTTYDANQDGWMQPSVIRSVIGADQVDATGRDVTVALFDSGMDPHNDLWRIFRTKRIVDFTLGQAAESDPVFLQDFDDYGHGTHVAGIVGGSGVSSYGAYTGPTAPTRE